MFYVPDYRVRKLLQQTVLSTVGNAEDDTAWQSSIENSFRRVDALLTQLKTCDSASNLSFSTAVTLCRLGFFMTHRNFSSTESMHMWNHALYYEDGANLTASGFTENLPEMLEQGWSIKYSCEDVDLDALNSKHKSNNGMMLITGSYEDCVRKDKT